MNPEELAPLVVAEIERTEFCSTRHLADTLRVDLVTALQVLAHLELQRRVRRYHEVDPGVWIIWQDWDDDSGQQALFEGDTLKDWEVERIEASLTKRYGAEFGQAFRSTLRECRNRKEN